MIKLSTGDDSTLGNYRKLASAIFGEHSEAVKFLDNKINNSLAGENEEVIADERKMIFMLGKMMFQQEQNLNIITRTIDSDNWANCPCCGSPVVHTSTPMLESVECTLCPLAMHYDGSAVVLKEMWERRV